MSESNTYDIKRDIASICDAAGQAILIQGMYAAPDVVNLQSIDNSLVCSFFFPQNEVGRNFITDKPDQEVSFIGLEIFRMLSVLKHPAPFRAILTLPTLYETGNSFINISKKFEVSSEKIYNNAALYDRVMRLLDPRDNVEYGAISSDDIVRIANEMFSLLPVAMKSDNFDVFTAMVRNSTVSGLGDYYSKDDYRRVKARLISLTRKISGFLDNNRDRRHGESEGAFQFRNNIDAINFAIPIAYQGDRNDVHLGFATPFSASLDRQISAQRDAEVRGALKKRTLPFGLYLLLRSSEIGEQISSNKAEASHWLQALADRAEICKKYLEHAENPSQISDIKKREIHLFYEDFMAPLFEKRYRASSGDEAIRKARELFTSREAFRDRFQQTSEKIDHAAKDMMAIKTVINSDELASDLGILNDPRVKAIRKRYNLG